MEPRVKRFWHVVDQRFREVEIVSVDPAQDEQTSFMVDVSQDNLELLVGAVCFGETNSVGGFELQARGGGEAGEFEHLGGDAEEGFGCAAFQVVDVDCVGGSRDGGGQISWRPGEGFAPGEVDLRLLSSVLG